MLIGGPFQPVEMSENRRFEIVWDDEGNMFVIQTETIILSKDGPFEDAFAAFRFIKGNVSPDVAEKIRFPTGGAA